MEYFIELMKIFGITDPTLINVVGLFFTVLGIIGVFISYFLKNTNYQKQVAGNNSICIQSGNTVHGILAGGDVNHLKGAKKRKIKIRVKKV